MSLAAVVKKEFDDSIRSNVLLGLTLLFLLFATFLAAIQWLPVMYRDSTATTSTLVLLNSMRQPTVMLVPLIGLGIGYGAIVRERETGSLKLMLGLPNTRRDVLLGKFVGRTAVVGIAILVGYSAAGIIALVSYDAFDVVVFGLFTLLTLGYGGIYIAIGTCLSAVTKSRTVALSGAIFLYALFMLGWDAFLLLLQLVTIGPTVPESGLPDWIQFVGILNPSTSFMYATRAVIPQYYAITIFPESNAFYLQDWVGFVVLALWVVVTLGIGYVRFEKADIE
ncbi:ABC transporter permease [Haladaptatus sp. T7]|uniref:ABC transporter permease n=1 Tax=Haladaptatus sp. T7 TaxID=2029368 RepID=UPI0021A259B5|nr:ABC transporter permease [Haladaptatus sp. T7]GKZ12789.1 membrane protein NosY [Haladaptatus sp. T7]